MPVDVEKQTGVLWDSFRYPLYFLWEELINLKL